MNNFFHTEEEEDYKMLKTWVVFLRTLEKS